LPVIVSSPCLSLPAQQGIRFTGASSVVDDINESANTDSEVYDPTPTNATKIIIGVLDGAYRDNDGPMFLVSNVPDFLLLQAHLATAPVTVLTLLAKHLKVQLVRG
jgi:hypothetical protein